MTTLRYTAFTSALLGCLLIGCGGPSFTVSTEPAAAGASGDEDTAGAGMGPAGAPSAGSGGQAGAAQPSAGSGGTAAAGAVGGTSGVGGSTGGSAAAGAAGLGSAGSDAGESGSGGTAAGSGGSAGTAPTAGSGPVEPGCTPSEAIRLELLPTTLEWGGLSVEADGACMDSAGSTCSLTYQSIGYEDAFTKEKPSSFGMRVTCDAPILCGCDIASTVGSGVIVDSFVMAFTFEPSGDGYVTHFRSVGGGSTTLVDESDASMCPKQYSAFAISMSQSASAAFVDGKLWACPS